MHNFLCKIGLHPYRKIYRNNKKFRQCPSCDKLQLEEGLWDALYWTNINKLPEDVSVIIKGKTIAEIYNNVLYSEYGWSDLPEIVQVRLREFNDTPDGKIIEREYENAKLKEAGVSVKEVVE